MPSVFTIKGTTPTSDCNVVGGDDPKVRKAARQAQKICERMRRDLEPLGVSVVLGGSFRSGLAIPPEGDHNYDIDLRFLFDGNRQELIQSVESATGLAYKKAVEFPDESQPVYKFSGRVESGGVAFDVDGDLRDTNYFGWQKLYPQVLTPAELKAARQAKMFLRRLPDDRKAYKALKQALIKEVQQRAKAQGLAGSTPTAPKAGSVVEVEFPEKWARCRVDAQDTTRCTLLETTSSRSEGADLAIGPGARRWR
jgi:hypothetical protein